MSEVTAKFYTKERLNEIRDDIENKMLAVGRFAQNKLKERLTNPLGGRRPWLRTGMLRDSIRYQIEKSGDDTTAIVGTPLKYGKYLEFGTVKMPPYPWLFPTIEEHRGEIRDILGAKAGVGSYAKIGETQELIDNI